MGLLSRIVPGGSSDARPEYARGGTGAGLRAAFRVALVYLVISVLWILVSDQVAARLASGPEALTRIQTLKGWAFVLGSAALLFALVGRELRLKQAAVERQVREERRYRAMIEGLEDVIAVIAADGTVEYASPSIGALTGYGAEEIEGRSILRLVSGEDEAKVRSLLADAARGLREGLRTELRLRHRDGTTRYVDITARNFLDDTSVRAIVVNARDVSAHRGLEDQLRHAQKMEAVGRLAGGVVHDFNNALTVIQGCAANLQDAIAAGAPHARDVEDLLQAARHGKGVVGQLLAFSRRQPLERETIDVNERIREIAKVVKTAVPSRIELTLELDADPPWVLMGRDHLDQVLMNLVVNARDAIPGEGRLVLRTGTAPGTGPDPGPMVEVSVTDTGEGIPAAVREHIFEPFFTTKPEGEGTGLGLAVVFGTVQQNGGTIELETEPGEGTTFRLRFPVSEPGEREPAAAVTRAEPGPTDLSGDETILVVEDEVAVRSLASRSLRKYGYAVVEAGDGEEALRVLEERGPVDLVVTDTIIPRMGGERLVARLQDLESPPAVLLVSGHPGDELGQVHDVAFLSKPYTPKDLAGRIRRILDRRDA